MKLRLGIALLAATSLCSAQGWSESYESALKFVKQGDWSSARDAFKSSIALRPEDQSAATTLPGTRERWRSGAPYSPNFGASYCLYKSALILTGAQRTQSLKQAASEFEALLAKKQLSQETYYFLGEIYDASGDSMSLQALRVRLKEDSGRLKWKIDPAIVSESELQLVASIGKLPAKDTKADEPEVSVIKQVPASAIDVSTSIGAPRPALSPSSFDDHVPWLDNKFAIVIGNGANAIPDSKISFATSDATSVRDALVRDAGYAESHVDVLLDATAEQIRSSVAYLAERVPQDATVLIYFTGVGTNVGGVDYYAGVDAQAVSDTGRMVAVKDVYRAFLVKGASIFAFNQAARSINSGAYFGMEKPLFGRISQAQATISGARINSLIEGGKEVGAYTSAFMGIIADFRSNQVPIMEFAWQVFYRMRKGGGPQTPPLPLLTVISADARF